MAEHCACPTQAERSRLDLHRARTSQTTSSGPAVPQPRSGRGELEVGHALEQLLDRDAHLEPRQVRADAAMRADPERHVAAVPPVEVELVGVLEDGLVAVGRAEQQEQPIARLQRLTAEARVAGDRAREAGDRRVQAQRLLDHVVDQRRIGSQRRTVRRDAPRGAGASRGSRRPCSRCRRSRGRRRGRGSRPACRAGR